MKYIIGTGWWCDGTGIHSHTKHQQYVDVNTRKKSFFELWHNAIKKFSSPEKILIIDSASPIKPDLSNKENIYFYSLGKNYGAAIDGTKNRCLSGWDRSILMSASIAFFEDCDYYVYVEQDCLIKGEGIIEHAINKMGNKPLMVGNGRGTPQKIQQSFIIIKKEYIPFFFSKETTLSKDQLAIDPEQRYYQNFNANISYLPFGYGRQRPINFNEKFFYAQHLRTEELREFEKILR